MSHSNRACGPCTLFALGLVAAALAAPLRAQQADIDEIIVTARKKEENLQDVPLSITAITAEEIERQSITSVDDVARLDASLIFDRGYSATDNRIAIRGLSPTRGRVNVAVLVDGIDTSSESIAFGGGSLLATNRLLDLERIEIVKGPQAALYGRSAFAGAISYVTKDPSADLGGSLRLDIGEYGRQEIVAGFGGPVGDTLGMRLNVTSWDDDGVHRNSVTGERVGGGDGWGAALTTKWTPSDVFDAKLRLEYTDDEYDQGATASVRSNEVLSRPAAGTQCLPVLPGQPMSSGCPEGQARVYAPTFGPFPGGNSVLAFRGTVPDGDDLRVKYDRNVQTGTDYAGSARELSRASLVLNWRFGAGTLTSFTGYTDAEFSFDEDGDFDSGIGDDPANPTRDAALRAARFDYTNETKQLSQELRFQSDLDGFFNFAIGGLYWNEEAEQEARSINLFCIPALPAGVFGPFPLPASCGTLSANEQMARMQPLARPNGREIDHTSVYGLVEFEFARIWRFTAEARYSDETETVLGVNCSPSNDLPPNSVFPGFPGTVCADVSLAGSGFQVFGPSINLLYPFVPIPTPPFVGPDPNFPRQAPDVPVELESDHSFTTPRVTLEVAPTDDLMFYATAAKAVKPGGISTVTAGSWQDANYDGNYDEFTFRDEELIEYELGAKMTFLDGRLRVNPAVFFQDYKDKQVGAQLVTPSGIAVGRLLNAGQAEIKGLELDTQWAATDHLFLGLNYTYLDAEFTDFPLTSTSPTDAVRFGGCLRGPDPRLCYFDLAGNQVERAPEHALVLLARYGRPIGSGGLRWYVEGDGQHQSKRYVDIWNTNELASHERLNLRFGLATGTWEALVYVDNVLDDDTVLSANSNPGDVDKSLFDPTDFSPSDSLGATLPDPRIVGVRFAYRF
jgi:outer membrane receptor protein involved in Fe transport